ncbi:ABC transporter substrate-binding protein [Loigolactobacillus backii]|uniref:Peptide ABC transporter substrate-binding protein n=1 Tax=Loigolactobacillus backii TaxID=375175 RepID=A0A192H1A4_9LACO|nr:ABC transporter substrate-binding protein [Loigolactobacillus backii]ANK62063.1 peptide ABC transporter substrate-binding protein [Loigolactobacillus backii]ANK65318.1 peptide ABC transporter substrate-binding protein [Loigolactobacillus backii]ANK68743.1 peptide ABC transporter substrate-binding protein [Loigolactobacillus backii]MDA5386747.1 ABC transporter substrate-binding protein [Loigolactobacillus backii]MDA5389272.1 ABC transporter substrate-binding protein [Loigolactobacillus backi
MLRFKKIGLIASLLGAFMLFSGTTTTASQAAATRQVTDLTGKKVTIPKKINRVADLWHANNQVVLLLGGQHKLVATTDTIKQMPWFVKVYPQISKVTSPFSGDDLQTEELLKVKPDVVLTSDPKQAEAATKAGIPSVNVMYQNFAGLKKSVKTTATVLGGSAPKVANTYVKQLDSNISYVKKHQKKNATKQKVLHIVNPTDLLKVDGTGTIVNEWIKLSGGQNAIKTKGNMIQVTAEQIVKANPDVIIVGSTSSKEALAALRKDSRFADLKAVKAGRVYGNPQGTFPWDRYSAEESLQVLWAAKKLNPSQFKQLNMTKKTQQFYQQYYNYDLSKADANRILAGEKPAK